MNHLKTIAKSAVSLCFAALAFNAQATLILDQNQADENVHMAAFSQADLAQSFEQTNDNIAGAGILLRSNIGSTGLVSISLWDALPTNGGNELATGNSMGTQGEWIDVFWNPITITPNTTMFLVFESNSNLGIAGSTANPYAFGSVFANSGFGNFPSYDYTFRTYFDDEQVAQVAEPGSLTLLGLGLIGVAVARRKK